MSTNSIEFSFVTDDQSRAYFIAVVEEMAKLFNISQEEAIGRVNSAFAGEEIVGSCEELFWLYHETAEDQARFIYYESGTLWWLDGEPLRPRPYP